MPFLDTIPALVKVGTAFVLIVGINRFRVHLSLALFLGAAFLGVVFGMSPGAILVTVGQSLLDPAVAGLLGIVAIILTLSRIMSDCGQLERLVTSFTRLTRDSRMAALVMPALIGLLPMPGGALFSAPMVDTACGENPVEAEIKTAVNYWFRHIWEYWWPLYPGVVLAVGLLGVEAWRFMAIQAPLSVIVVVAGLVFLLPRLPRNPATPRAETHEHGQDGGSFLREARPILLVILALPAVWLFEKLTGITPPRLTAVFLGLGLCMTWVVVQNRPSAGQVVRTVTNRSSGLLLLLICGIMAFKGVLMESQAVVQIQEELVRYGIPAIAVLMVVPFLAGFITGIAVGFVGASFPLVLALIAGKTGLDFLAHASLAYAFGYMGMMLSPVHVCFVVTRDYFHAGLGASYRHIIGPAALVLVLSLGYFLLLLAIA